MKPHHQQQSSSSSIASSISTLQNTHNKLQKQIDNTNREIVKCYEHHHSAILKIQALLGLGCDGDEDEEIGQQKEQQQPIPSSPYGQFKSFNKPKQPTQKPIKPLSQPSLLLSLNEQQILYYSCKYFIIYNITNKQYQIINKDIKNCTLKMIKKFNTNDNDNKLIVCVYQTGKQTQQESTFLALLSIRTDYDSRTSRNQGRYSWRVVRLSTQLIHVQDYTYFAKKNFLYLVVNKQNMEQKYVVNNNFLTESNKDNETNKNTTQFLYIYDLTKQIFQLNQQIRSNTVGFFVQFVCLQDSDKVYLCGRNYFRQWLVNFNEKSMKESNVRNIERVLKGKVVVDVQEIDRYGMKLENDNFNVNHNPNNNPIQQQQIPFLNTHLQPNSPILTHPSKLLIVLTQQQILLIKQNELICSFTPQQNISKNLKSKQNIQKELQNSFNQIHKMKFLFDQYQQMRDREDYYMLNNNGDNVMEKSKKEDMKCFTAMSKSWKTQNQNYYIAIANSKYALLIYQLVDYQFKLYTEIDYLHKDNINLVLRNIVPTQCGDILLCVNDMNQVHMVNQQNMDIENNQSSAKSMWGNAHLHHGQIYGITSPMIQNIMCTVGEDETFKLWSMKKNERCILFECKSPGSRPLGITMHPSGTMVCVNFQREIRLYAILPHQFYEITNIKTNYCPLQLKYSDRGQFLVSNQGSVLIFYQSFSLKTLGYIEPADVQFKIIDFKISKNAGYICFLTEDNACFLQSIDIGDLSQWDHFSPVHRQVQPYTAFYFDFIEKDKNVSDEKKVRNLFIGATRNKYIILYENLGSKLLTQFPIVDCYIVDIEIYENLMFAATNKGTIRVYNWPILQQQLELEIINAQTNQIRYKPPKYEEYQIWHETIPIMQIHKLNFTTELIITNTMGNIAIFSFQQTKNKKIIYEEISPQRKKMQQLINQMFYIKRSEIEKRNKLIEKTENDILKVENQILREKISLERKMQDEETGVRKGYEMKGHVQVTEKEEYIEKQEDEIALLKREIVNKKNSLQQLKQFITNDYQQKKIYQQSRNDKVTEQIKQIILQHKQKIKRKIQTHKEDIRNKKKEYFIKVKQIQQQFDKEVVAVYEGKLKEMSDKFNSDKLLQNQEKDGEGRLEFIIGGGIGMGKTKSYNKKEGTQKQERRKSSDFIMNLLADNVLTISNSTQQTDNENIKGLIGKLQGIQKQQYQNSMSNEEEDNFDDSIRNVNMNDSSSGGNNYGSKTLPANNFISNNNNFNNTKPPLNLNTQNSFKTFTNLQQQQKQQQQKQQKQPTSKLLKRSTKYQLNEKAFLKKKLQQQQQQKIKQLQQKLTKSHQLMQREFNDEIIEEMTSKQNEDIVIQSMRVQELQRNNLQLEKQILSLKMKVTEMENQDELLQKDFQAHLEEYNLSRFKNLNLHCEVLKMQNQLVERKQVLDNKQEIVMLAYQQKQKLQNYKQMVKGSLTKLQQNKQSLRQMFYKKQTDLNVIFSQLVNAIHKMETKKDNLLKLERKMKEAQKQQESKEKQLNEVVGKLKEVKKYLLLEKMTDEKSQKSIYQYEESLIQTINFLKKRLFMQSIKEKKNKQLKKSTLNQVLKQNKNLLQECNQLRSEGIEYENEIRNLSSKLKEANKMILIETKLKSQKHDVNEQKNQLEVMKKLFKMQLDEFEGNEGIVEEEQQSGREQQKEGYDDDDDDIEGNVKEVYFDAAKKERQQRQQRQKQINTKKYTKVDTKINNLIKKQQKSEQKNQQNCNQYKPFKLSKYISAEPYEKI